MVNKDVWYDKSLMSDFGCREERCCEVCSEDDTTQACLAARRQGTREYWAILVRQRAQHAAAAAAI